MKKIGVVFLYLSIFTDFSEAQIAMAGSKPTISQAWVYPIINESLIKPFVFEANVTQNCQELPPDSVRIFGNIRGLACDRNDNLYVWDDGYQALWKFTSEGNKLWRKKYPKGTGDAEFLNVGPAFAVSKNGELCLGDKQNKTITLMDSSGEFKNKFKLNMLPASITFGLDGTLYIEGFQMSYSGNIIHHYSSSGKFLGSFCERKDTSFLARFSGNCGRLITDHAGNIIYSHSFPYFVEIFSPDGHLMKTIERAIEGLSGPTLDTNIITPSGQRGKIVNSHSALKGLTLFNDQCFFVAVMMEQDSNKWGLDFFSFTGNFQKTLSVAQFPKPFWYRYSTADSEGNVYFDLTTQSDPIIVKYHITL
jgi:hypothetical protein